MTRKNWELYSISRIGIKGTYYMYPGNLKTSTLTFFAFGVFWQYEGSIRELLAQTKESIKNVLL